MDRDQIRGQSICVYCHQSFSYTTHKIPKYCSKQCRQLGYTQKIDKRKAENQAITTCKKCGKDIRFRKYIKPYCKSCLRNGFKPSINPIPISQPTMIEVERGDLCFLKETRGK